MYFQELILALQDFWAKRGCLIVQPYNSEVGAGTYNPATFLRALGPEPWNVAFVEPSRRSMIKRDGLEVKLTNLEFHLLHLLMSRPGRVFGPTSNRPAALGRTGWRSALSDPPP